MIAQYGKRALSLFLAMIMVLSAVPMQVFAEDGHDHQDEGIVVTSEPTEASEPSEPTASEPAASEPTESEALIALRADIAAYVETYGLTADMPDSVLANVYFALNGEQAYAAYFGVEAFLERGMELALEERVLLLEEQNSKLVKRFYEVMQRINNPVFLADSTFAPVDGVSVVVSGTTDSATESGGAITVKMTGTTSCGVAGYNTANVKITNTSAVKALITFNWANNSCVDANKVLTANPHSVALGSGASLTIELRSPNGSSDSGTFTLSGFTCEEVQGSSNVTFQYNDALGAVTVNGEAVANGAVKEVASSGAALVAAANEGATFLGWTDSDGKILSTATEYTLEPDADMTLTAAFASATTSAWFRVDKTHLFNDLNAAAAAGTKIVLAENGILPAGDYTIPSGKTLLIPFDANETVYTTKPAYKKTTDNVQLGKPNVYRTLTMATGANLTVKGAMSVCAPQYAAGGSKQGSGMPYEWYGYVKMDKDSAITIPSGGALYCYGYINGSGSVLAQSGSTVYESFLFEDFRGGTQMDLLVSEDKQGSYGVFPLSSYYVQNIMVPLTLEAGATEYSYASLATSFAAAGSSVAFISESGAMFNLTSGTVTKQYDHATDRLIITSNGTIEINNISMGIATYKLNSANYELPINGNMTVNIDSGSIKLNQDVALLPGAVINIGSNATCSLGTGANLYLYDVDDWGTYVGSGNKKMYPAYFVPERTKTRSEADLKDAEINIAGAVSAAGGYVYTTAGGAAIKGTEGASATIQAGETTAVTYQMIQDGTPANSQFIEYSVSNGKLTSARLMNADGSFVETTDDSAGNKYVYKNGIWHLPNCQGIYDAVETKKATCEGKGTMTYTCRCVGDIYTEDIAPINHNYSSVVTAPTCTERGYTTYTCNNGCGSVLVDNYVDPTGHSYGEWKVVTAATCEAEGSKTRTCKVPTCNHPESEVIPAAGHSYGEWKVTAATCEKDGVQTKTCSKANCPNPIVTETIPATNHADKTNYPAVEATCNADGSTTPGHIEYWQCNAADCKKYFDAEGNEITLADTVITASHSYDSGVYTAPTCTEDGYDTFTCTSCGHFYTLPGEDATGHSLKPVAAKDPTCEAAGNHAYWHCADCGGNFADENGQTDFEGEVTISATGHQSLTHENAVAATCEAAGNHEYWYCSDCGNYYLDKECTEAKNLADVTVPKQKHNYVESGYLEPTCTKPGYIVWACSYECGKSYNVEDTNTEALNHDFTVASSEVVAEATCTSGTVYKAKCAREGCGEISDTLTITGNDVLKHSYSNKLPGSVKNPATCTTAAVHYVKCDNCDHETTDMTVPYGEKLDHDWDNGVIKEDCEPTCTKSGIRVHSCKRDGCNATKEEPEDPLGHAPVDQVSKAPTCTEPGLSAGSVCSRCGHTEGIQPIPAQGHDFTIPSEEKISDATCTSGTVYWAKCAREGCGVISDKVTYEANDVLDHSFNEKASKNQATDADCENAATYYVQCDNCEAVSETKTVSVGEPKAHSFTNKASSKIAQEATCTAKALYYVQCDNCNAVSDTVTVESGKLAQHVVEAVEIPATCTEDGSITMSCINCTYEILVDEIPALGHSMTKTVAEEATCTEDGNVEYHTCGSCEKIFADANGTKELSETAIPAIGHDMTKTEAKAPTCTASGNNEYYTCGNCKEVFKDEDGTVKTNLKDETLGKLDHSVSEAVTPATCTEGGYTTRSCANCSYHYIYNETPALGHTNVIDKAVAPTCTEPGLTEGLHCSVCGEVLTAQDTVDALGHEEVEIPAIAPNCWRDGLTAGIKCETCGTVLKEQKVDPMIPHTEEILEAKAATCTEPGLTEGKKCTACNTILQAQEVIAALNHDNVVDEAVAPTCAGTGLTEGTHCDRCGEVFVAQEVIDALPHTEVVDAGKDPTCEDTGISEGKHCSVCGEVLVAQEEIPANGHKLEYHDKQLPTNYTGGWEAYETCKVCEHSTYEEIPALGEPEITTYDDFLYNLQVLETYANEYVKQNPSKDPMALLIKYVRTGVDRYNSGSWNIMAGYEDADFAKFVKDQEEAYNRAVSDIEERSIVTGMKNLSRFKLPNGDVADIGHMFGTMDISYHNNNGVNHADVAGWAGDTVDLVSLSDQFGVVSTELEALVEEVTAKYFMRENDDLPGEPDEGTFSRTDVYGDLDGYYVMQTLWNQEYEAGLLYRIISSYFTAGLSDEQRAEYFLKNRLGGVTSRTDIRDAVFNAYTGNKVIATLEGTRNFKTANLALLRKASCYTFADYLCKLAGDYNEKVENVFYEVSSCEKSTLTPGITQEIYQAYTADGKQTRFYVATADINSPYINVYANYKDNDPAAGWGMSRVRDQANAAQAKYGDPSSPDYIENYNVIAAINGAGFNMETGEPGGLLVMGGVEYHEPNANGFFGILKDGSAVIGTTEEYNTIYKDQVQEGIAAFGSTLVKDGKVSINRTESYYTSRASRTAVGITKTGKVVFMVMDGRQEPVSCGGSMEEIAQVMLDAGCYHAVNLDGGGSTTYVAKQEGDDVLSVVNNPSDGFERSVSTSLIMVSTAPNSTAFDHAVLEAETAYLTIGSSVDVIATGASATGNPAELPDGIQWVVSDSSIASIDQNGTVTGLANGTVDVNLMLGDEILGTKTMHVVIPDVVYFERERMDAIYGESLVLPVRAKYSGKKVIINENDVTFSLSNAAAGTFDGFNFTAVEGTGLKAITVTAALKQNAAVTGTMALSLFHPDEASFDFDSTTGGSRQFAWVREISNAVSDDDVNFMVEDVDKPMVTEYTFAIDMTQIPIPEELADLTYMLPGADVEGASAWTFLMQLAERVSVLTEVRPVIKVDPNFEVDCSGLTLMNDYFTLEGIELDEATNELALSLRWVDQTMPIDPATANPLCILSGLKLTPKSDAQWNSAKRLPAEHTGKVGYTIYLRANALYAFASKEENQKIFNLYPFMNEDVIINGAPESGGYFSDIYAEFADEYTLVNSRKSGWVYEENGYAYYVNEERLTGVQEVDGYYYDFGTDGINKGQEKYTGLFTTDDGKCHYAKKGELATGWIKHKEESYLFDENGDGCHGSMVVEEVLMEFDNGKLIGGFTGFIEKSDGKTYHYENGQKTYGWLYVGEELYHFNVTTGAATTGTKVQPDDEAVNKKAYYDFAENGRVLCGYFNPAGFYYWAGLPKPGAWVKNGADEDPDAWYRTIEGGHFITDLTSNPTVRLQIDGVIYTFDNTNGKLLKGQIVKKNGKLYYYWVGAPRTDGWFQIDGDTYYAYPDGHLATGTCYIGGKSHTFNNSGVLLSNASIMDISFNSDESMMSTTVMNIMAAKKVRIAVWSQDAGEQSKQWYDAARSSTGEWTCNVPMCAFGRTGVYHVEAYSTFNGVETYAVGANVIATRVTDHRYTDEKDAVCDLCNQTTRDPNAKIAAVYRLFNPHTGEHFWTKSRTERDILISGKWNYESIGFYCPVEGNPVYRLFHPTVGDHMYTKSQKEVEILKQSGWNYEGIAFYSSADSKEVPVYRLHNPNLSVGSHHFTKSEKEKGILLDQGWNYEGIGWYGCKP